MIFYLYNSIHMQNKWIENETAIFFLPSFISPNLELKSIGVCMLVQIVAVNYFFIFTVGRQIIYLAFENINLKL